MSQHCVSKDDKPSMRRIRIATVATSCLTFLITVLRGQILDAGSDVWAGGMGTLPGRRVIHYLRAGLL